MGVMTLSEFQDAVRYSLDNRGDLDATTQLTRWINWSYVHVGMPNVHRHRELQTTFDITLVTDDIDYRIDAAGRGGVQTAGIYDVTHIQGTSSTDASIARRRLDGPCDIREFDESQFRQGPPARWTTYGTDLVIDTRPSTTENGQLLVMRVWREPALLVNPSDVTTLLQLWDEAIALGARWRGWRELNRPDRAELAKQDFGAMVNEINARLNRDAEDWGGRAEPVLHLYMPV